jgi:hypothetical protein
MRLCQRMDLTAEISVITLNVKQAAPPIRIAGSLADLFELPSYSINSPRTNRVADSMISKNVDTLLMERPPASVSIASRHPRREAVGFGEFSEGRLHIDFLHF